MAALMLLVLPIMKWLVLPKQGSWEVDMWCLGSLMAGVGIVLLGLRPMVPTVVSFHLANTLIMGCLVSMIQSMRMGLKLPTSWSGWVGRMLLVLLFYSALYEWAPDAWRGVLYRFALGCLGIYAAYLAWRLARRMDSLNAVVIAGAHLIAGLSLMLHSIWTAGRVVDPLPFSDTRDVGMLYLALLLLTVVTHLCYVGMVLDMASRDKLQTQQAQQAAEQTQMLDTQLTHLDRRGRVAIVSGSLAHELNQPLTAATMNAQLAERQWSATPASTPLMLTLLDQTEAAVNRTVNILQRIRREKELVAKYRQRVDLQEVLDRSLSQMRPEWERQKVTLTQDRSPHPVWCLADELCLSQVVINLLRNAIQAMASQAERHLWVTCAMQEDQARLVIRDSGPGMPTALIKRLGEPFLGTRDDGMGLGLAISREIVTRHHGQLQLCNHPQGGLQATVFMPLTTRDAA